MSARKTCRPHTLAGWSDAAFRGETAVSGLHLRRIGKKKTTSFFLACFFVITCAGASFAGMSSTLTQISTIGALMQGAYDGTESIRQLKRFGDTGLGTFNALDGEMVMVDGKVYRVGADGKAGVAGPGETTPFAEVAFFRPSIVRTLRGCSGLKELTRRIDALLPTGNLIYMLKIEGTFGKITTRSVPAQKRPYQPLVEVIKNQSIFKFQNVRGVIVGLRCPAYMKDINVPGYHLHFLTADRKAGGHVLDISVGHAVVSIEPIYCFHMVLPQGGDFFRLDLGKELTGEIRAVESQTQKQP